MTPICAPDSQGALLFYGTEASVRHLQDLFANSRSTVRLDRDALDIARLVYPGLDPDASLRSLDEIAAAIGAEAGRSASGAEFVQIANRRLFEELGFQGNEREYYDVRNS